ncbi:hypothetical protein F2Q68_00032296 [Brassica cretica]|uniref:Uncharacterized protein n=1 Tax=Brassica cretica TaxID=69181 RepID=A0A8S9GFD0_BRACR|nr:hypothetical protein F2Q68_00032296 [Brassica cretica]
MSASGRDGVASLDRRRLVVSGQGTIGFKRTLLVGARAQWPACVGLACGLKGGRLCRFSGRELRLLTFGPPRKFRFVGSRRLRACGGSRVFDRHIERSVSAHIPVPHRFFEPLLVGCGELCAVMFTRSEYSVLKGIEVVLLSLIHETVQNKSSISRCTVERLLPYARNPKDSEPI